MAIATGLSYWQIKTITVVKSRYEKSKYKFIFYKKYTNISYDAFRENLIEQINNPNFQYMTLDTFKQLFLNILEKLAPLEHKYVRANQAHFMNKALNKLLMDRSRLKKQIF